MKRGYLICIIGIDGAGKTTLAKSIMVELTKKGIPVEYRWGKFESYLLRFFILVKNKLLVREKDWRENYEKSLEIKKNLLRNNFVSRLYEYFVLINYTFQVISKITIPLKLGKNVICDRYVYDTIVDMVIDLGYSDEKVKRRLSQLFILLPSPDIFFFIDVPEEVAFRRKDDIPSLEFLKIKKEVYLKILKFLKARGAMVCVINGTNPIHNLEREVATKVIEYLREC